MKKDHECQWNITHKKYGCRICDDRKFVSGGLIFRSSNTLDSVKVLERLRDGVTLPEAESALISGGGWGKRSAVEQGVPRWAEKIPFEPDLGNASVGSGDWCVVRESHQGPSPSPGHGPFFIVLGRTAEVLQCPENAL
jgi:hypothetical protein